MSEAGRTRLPVCLGGTSIEVMRVLAWSPDGTLIAAHDGDGSVCVIELASWRLVRRVGRGGFARFWPDGRGLAFVDDDGDEVHLVDPAAGWSRRSFAGMGIRAFAFDGTARLAIAGSRELAVWDLARPPAAGPTATFGFRPGFTIDLAFAADRLVGLSSSATDFNELRLEADLAAPAPALSAAALPAIDGVSRSLVLDDGSALLRTGVRRGRVVLEVLDAVGGGLRRTIDLPGTGHVARLTATPDGATIVVELGESNGPQRLVALAHAPSTEAVPQVLEDVEWGLGGLIVAPAGDALIYDLHGTLWHRPLAGGAVVRRSSAVFLTAAATPAPAALVASPAALEPIGLPDGDDARLRTPAARRTRALLIAGRAIDSYLPTHGQLAAIRALVARHGDGVVAAVAGDETAYVPGEHQPADALHARIVVGIAVAEADCDLGPRGPIDVAGLRAGLTRTAALGELFWRGVVAILAARPTRFPAAVRRTSMAGERIAPHFDDIALDAPDLLAIVDRVHLVPTGPLAYGEVVVGVPGAMPDDVVDPEERQHWHAGHDSRQERHAVGVRGESVAVADAHGLGTSTLDLDRLDALLTETPGTGVYVLARYD